MKISDCGNYDLEEYEKYKFEKKFKEIVYKELTFEDWPIWEHGMDNYGLSKKEYERFARNIISRFLYD